MPKEITFEQLNDALLDRTIEIYQKKSGDDIKYKFRTKGMLYTLKVPQDQVTKVENLISSNSKSLEIIPV
ncbi:MAG: hypothetical protein OEZ01_08005 [Candidatus Heimdallarchaeota archaeon]|nr:hypothetical protein [Candidatus Heimdallarchaeota archaeon]MDH5645936.1 hypothetical protein [Candidatus Heimdallarchaeota archaeon]